MTEKYTCALCGETFDKVRPDEEALAESKNLWGDLPEEDLDVICDDCFQSGFDDAYAEHKKQDDTQNVLETPGSRIIRSLEGHLEKLRGQS